MYRAADRYWDRQALVNIDALSDADKEKLAKNTNYEHYIRELANDPGATLAIKSALIRNKYTPADILLGIFGTLSPRNQYVAARLVTNNEALEQLASTVTHPKIKVGLLQNPKVNQKVVYTIVSTSSDQAEYK